LLDSISNISLVAASCTKSAVFGATPISELTPVFSAADWAMTGPASEIAIEAMMIFFMVWSPGWWHQNFKSAKLFPARSAIVMALAL
jgi:hypothetical protein